MKLYITPPSILTLVTWVPQSRLAFGHSAHRQAIVPPALAKQNPTVRSLSCRWRLRSALRDDRESFLIESCPLFDSMALCQQLRVVLQQYCNKYFVSKIYFFSFIFFFSFFKIKYYFMDPCDLGTAK